jgi:hypothetical protein
MPASVKKPALLILIAVVTAALFAATAQAPPPQSVIFSGPSERTPLVAWTLAEDPSNVGLARGWQRGGFSGAGVNLPNVVRPLASTGPAGARNYAGSIAWYRTPVLISQPGVYALSFQSANYLASVWLDGRALGSHHGSYLPFEMRTTLAPGTHLLVVRVDWRHPSQQSREGFHRTWFNWGGLNGEVDIRPIGASELSAPTLATTLSPDAPDAQTASVAVTVQLRNNGPSRTIQPQGSLAREGQTVTLPFAAVAVGHGQTVTVAATATVSAPALWSPPAPNLYELSVSVPGESNYVARVGLRQLTWHGGRVYLNGQHLLLHGATIQEDAATHGDALLPADQEALVEELRAIGANSARAQHPLDQALLERLDAAGILLWQGIGPVEGAGNWYSDTPALLAAAEAQARTAAVADELHPSIFAWNLVDEVAENGRDADEVAYVRDLARWLHVHDPTRLVGVDVWGDHPPQHAGPLYALADAVAETDYSGWYDYPHVGPAALAAKMRARLAAMERTFAGKVLVISEFGAESNTLNPPGLPGSYAYQARLLAEHIAVYAADPKVSAMLIWLLRDYSLNPSFEGGSIHNVLPRLRLIEGLNQKGLFTRAGVAKPAATTVARLFRALPAG